MLGKLTMQEMEITELSSRSIETSLQVKQVVLKVLDVYKTTFVDIMCSRMTGLVIEVVWVLC